VDVLNPVSDPSEARAAFEAFLDASNSSLRISDPYEKQSQQWLCFFCWEKIGTHPIFLEGI